MRRSLAGLLAIIYCCHQGDGAREVAFQPKASESINFRVWATRTLQPFYRPCFLGPQPPSPQWHRDTRQYAKAKKGSGDSSGKKKAPSSSMRGFGVYTSSKKSSASSSSPGYELLIEPDVLEMVRWLQNNGASLSGLALARFPEKGNLRGVVALKPFKKGDIIVSIPSDVAIDLGGSNDPGAVGLNLVRKIQNINTEGKGSPQEAYIRLLPKVGGQDFGTTTDFFSEKELEMLQWPPVQQETTQRVQRIKEIANKYSVDEEELKWAVWLVVSRVIAVKLPGVGLHKLLIPFLDLFNHDGASPHQLSPGVVQGSNTIMLCVVAGDDINEGEEVTFAYGAGMIGSDRMIQDYGFLDQVTTRRADVVLVKSQEESVRQALQATTLEEDKALLASGGLSPNEALAVQFRIALKESLLVEEA